MNDAQHENARSAFREASLRALDQTARRWTIEYKYKDIAHDAWLTWHSVKLMDVEVSPQLKYLRSKHGDRYNFRAIRTVKISYLRTIVHN